MENVIAIVALFALIYFFWFFLSKMVTYYREKAEAEERRREVIAEHLLQVRRESAARARARLETPIKSTKVAPQPEPAKPSYAPSPTQSMASYQSSRSLLDDAADVAMIANVIHHWNDKPHYTNTDNPIDFPKEERSVGVSKSESSWGFEDSDSRKSISSSMDTSSSWSSSSSDSYSSSSSDSGPSSDW
jgi:hypothetical protein